MSRPDPRLKAALEAKLGLSSRRVNELIAEKVALTLLPRHLAAIVLASENGITISKFASDEDLSSIRDARLAPPTRSATPSTDHATPAAPDKASGAGRRPATRGRKPLPKSDGRRKGKIVFVVHGRNQRARKSLFSFLRALGLQPLEWNQAIRYTGKSNPYIGQVLDAAFDKASAVVVLLTPDDEAHLKKEFWSDNDEDYEKRPTGQARANVLFEAGLAFGRKPERTVLVQLGRLRPFSDIGGRHVVHMSDKAEKRQELAMKLEMAGCDVDTSGTDWLSEGDFASPN
jgi:predicted nucleotide-binding protein